MNEMKSVFIIGLLLCKYTTFTAENETDKATPGSDEVTPGFDELSIKL